MSPRSKRLLEVAVVSACWVFATWFLWAVLLAPQEPVVPTVAFGDFVADVERGDVRDVSVKGRVYKYSVPGNDGRRVEKKQTTGPEPTIAQVRALRPKDPASRPPRIVFDER